MWLSPDQMETNVDRRVELAVSFGLKLPCIPDDSYKLPSNLNLLKFFLRLVEPSLNWPSLAESF